MKIILVSNLYPNTREPYRGLFNMHLMQALAGRPHDVEIIAPIAFFPGRDQAPPFHEQWNGLDVYHPKYPYTPGVLIHHHWRLYRLAVSRLLRERVKAAGDTPVHVILGFVYPDAVAMDAVCRKRRTPYSVLVLGSDFRIRMQQPRFRNLVLRCLRDAPLVFCPGQVLAKDIQDAGISSARIRPFNNGVDSSIFFAGTEPRVNELLFVGNLVPVKAPVRILRAFHALPELRAAGLKLVMIGSGPLHSTLQHTASSLGIPSEQIEWAGTMPQPALAARMRKARLLCLCSRSEGMPNVVLEALACGCPVVATPVGEVPYVLNLQNGILAEPAETEDAVMVKLAEAISQAYQTRFDPANIAAGTQSYRWELAAQTLSDAIQPPPACITHT